MECNKEEALRAKGIAESKMRNADYSGAHKIALKAQRLYSELENVSQMLVICEVHTVAEKKLFANETDWYGVLQVEQTADESTIKKNYRKLALQLHPDKNKFPGAEAAFKIIGEAQRLLLDKDKRGQHDMKRRAAGGSRKNAVPYRPQPKPSWPSNVGTQNNFAGINPQPQQPQRRPPAQQGPNSNNGRPTFWTTCPFCSVKYQFYREVYHKSIRCQHCHKSFIAYEAKGPEAAKQPIFTQTVFPQPRNFPTQGTTVGENSKPVPPQPSVKVEKTSGNRKRKHVAESSESSADTSSDEDIVVGKHGDNLSKQNGDGSRRRSVRQKVNVSYNENVSDDDDDDIAPGEKAKVSGSSTPSDENISNVPKEEGPKMSKPSDEAAGVKENPFFEKVILNGKKHDSDMNGKESDDKKGKNVDTDSDSELNGEAIPATYSYPDPDFNDFDKNREQKCFAVGQIWAIYDTLDAMPRFYALIRKTFSTGFKLRITWLESDPDDDNEIDWVDEGLPVSCGTFKCGRSEVTEDRLMFSHFMSFEKGSGNTFKVYPMKGETWAIFKNWNFSWSFDDANETRKYEYEFVEVLSEYKEADGVRVAYLAKVKGFVSVFCQLAKEGNKEIQIPSNELFRFAHKVPSFKLTGKEREGVPKESFELDPASLPTEIPEIDVKPETGTQQSGRFETSDKLKPTTQSKGSTSSPATEAKLSCVSGATNEDDVIVIEEDDSDSKNWDPDTFEIPEPEFFNFDLAKSRPNFQVNQIWSFYCPEDGLPKYYAQIKKVELAPVFTLYTYWLEPHPQQSSGLICWLDDEMPISCGKFKAITKKHEVYTTMDTFAHLSSFKPTGKKNEFLISPSKGEVWGMYKNWSADMKCSELVNCEHEIVEILSETNSHISVHLLERVSGFNTVYKIQMNGRIPATKQIPQAELLRFSHRIPFFRLTNERGGSLRGFVELDPAALPIHHFKP
ncbi:hypothetical protein ACFE04_005448 [Oxalis oulophora]